MIEERNVPTSETQHKRPGIILALALLGVVLFVVPARVQTALPVRISQINSAPQIGQPSWFYPLAAEYSAGARPMLMAFAGMLAFLQDSVDTEEEIDENEPDTLIVPPGPYLHPNNSTRLRSAGAGASRPSGNVIPPGYEYTVDVDAQRNVFRMRETIGTHDYSVTQSAGIDDYLTMRRDYLRREITDSITGHYDLEKALTSDEISNILNQATNLTIPIPPNPLSGIFGKPEVSINVSGEVNVRGGWRWDSQNLGTNSAFGQTQSGPIFDQDIKVNVNGRIGDKFKLGVDWSSRRQFEFDNKFRIGYEGYDDDIIKKVEVGNVQLNSGSSLIGGSQALFGVAADFQFGPVYLKTIASQKRGQRRFVQLKGGRLNQQFGIRAYEYAENHFFLDTAYEQVYRDYFAAPIPTVPPSALGTRIKEIEVWETVNQVQEVNEVSQGVAIADLGSIPKDDSYTSADKSRTQIQGQVERGRFQRLPQSRYQYNADLGILTILNLRRDRTYGVAYRYEGATTGVNDDQKYGTFADELRAEADTLVLKLVYRQNLQPGFELLWRRQLKNIYPLNVNNVNLEETDIDIWYFRRTNDSANVLQGSPDKIVTVLGVDRETNNSGDPNPDGKFDIQNRVFFNQQRGEIMFPSLEPFREGLRSYFGRIGNPALAEQYVYSAIYDTTKEVARLQTEKDRFVIGGQATGSSGSRITLPNGFNLAPGSVRVMLDGRQLREGTDYTVEYYSGTITVRNQQALLPNANLNVEYEQNDIFNLSTRTLVGMRADFDMKYLLRSRDITSNLGFTVMHYDQSLQVDRVRIGEEPVSNTMMGFDGQFNYKADWLTKAIDNLPLIDTKEPSSFSVRGEVAWMLPDPNKKKSDIPQDGGASVVYIDDFEGAQRYIPLGLTASQWTHSSPPVDSTIGEERADTVLADLRGRMYWYRYFIPRTPVRDVWPNRQTISANSNISDLHIRFDPDIRGIYNNNPDFVDTSAYQQGPRRDSIWGGMMRLLSSFNTNFDTDNIDYIEIMMNVEMPTQATTEMYIDLGQISEDVIPNRDRDTEDGITGLTENGIIDAGEDLGIDGVNNDGEKLIYPTFANEDDPARDDYFFDFSKDPGDHNPQDFLRYNNYEGNASLAQTGQFPDTEILNRNNGESLMQDNSFFRYKVDLNVDDINANPQIVGGNPEKRWYLFRIPIRNPHAQVGNPLFSNIQYVRVFWKGGVFQGRIAEWRLAGAQWQRFETNQSGRTDTTMSIAFVNREENSGAPDFYQMPPGVSAPRQLNNPDPNQDIRLNEQSLELSVENLLVGEERTAVRFFRPFDMFYYKRLKYFVHGDGTMPDTVFPGGTPPAYTYIRFGVDSLNYYEFRRPLLRGWRSVEIELSELTAIKQLRQSGTETLRQEFPSPNDPAGIFAIKGYPTLTRVQFIGFGIANPNGNLPNSLTTTMWINELRLLDAEDSNDWAGFVNTQVKMADLADMSLSFNQTNPNFHRLEQQFGDRVERKNWNFNFTAALEKFFPTEWRGTAIPLSYTHNERKEDPLFVSNSDINLEEAALAAEREALERGDPVEEARRIGESVRRRSQTLVVEDSWALQGIRIGFPSKDWYIRDIFNNVTVGYAYSQSFERSPVVAERFQWQWDLTAKYNVTIPPNFTVKPFTWAQSVPLLNWYSDFKISLAPANFNTGLTMSRGRITEQSRFLDVPSPVIRRFAADRSLGFSWKLTEGGLLNTTAQYTMNATSTLVPVELDENDRQRTGGEIFDRVLLNNGKFIDLGEDTRYRQNVTLNFKPAVPPVFGIDRFVTATGSFSTDYTWDNQLQSDPAYQDIAKSATFNNNIRFGLTFRMKSLADSWFGEESSSRVRRPRGRRPGQDSTDQEEEAPPAPGITDDFLKVFKAVFLDYDNVKLDFSQTNTARNPGVIGGNGMTNFWARVPLFRDEENIFGPSAAYQLGLVSNPHGGFGVKSSSSFPFIRFESFVGKRPANATMQDNFSQQTKLELRTSRPLWEGATLELNWSSNFGFNRNQTVTTNDQGVPSFSAVTITESYNRTFLSMPSFLLLGVFNNNVENVLNLYNERRAVIEAQNLPEVEENRQLAEALAESFRDGFEALSFLPEPLRQIMPRVNWFFRWEGLEKWSIFGGVARRIGLEHRYQSTYQENISVNDDGRQIESQSIDLGFQPLIGLNFQFDQNKVGGNLTAKLRYNTRTTYRVSTAARQTINKDVSNDFSLEVAYGLRGFEFPLFGVNLQNDVEFALLTQYRRTRRETFDLNDFTGENGDNLDGSTQIIIEPSARYTMSRRVRARAFFRYEANLTEGAARPGNTITEVGLDVSISIAGGR